MTARESLDVCLEPIEHRAEDRVGDLGRLRLVRGNVLVGGAGLEREALEELERSSGRDDARLEVARIAAIARSLQDAVHKRHDARDVDLRCHRCCSASLRARYASISVAGTTMDWP